MVTWKSTKLCSLLKWQIYMGTSLVTSDRCDLHKWCAHQWTANLLTKQNDPNGLQGECDSDMGWKLSSCPMLSNPMSPDQLWPTCHLLTPKLQWIGFGYEVAVWNQQVLQCKFGQWKKPIISSIHAHQKLVRNTHPKRSEFCGVFRTFGGQTKQVLLLF